MQDDGQLGLLATHQNNGLFSNHYLDNRLPERHEWKDALEFAERVYEDLQRRYEREAPFEGQSESQLERNWIRPIFSALGWESAVQVRLSTARTAREPDYILCRDAEVRRDIEGLTTATEDDLAEATAVADAKRWGRDLDHRGTSTSSLSSVPALQIDQYIRYSGLDWGILTNGRQWRLYHAGSSKDLDIYYEVDLESLLGQSGQNGAAEAFSYFYLLFRRDSFLGSDPFVDSLLEESRAYQNAVNEELEEQVFEALESIARGFFEYSGNDLAPTDENLEDVYDSSLILLYRLLFVLFAESRSLLPLDNPAYERNYSFFALKTDIAEDIDQRVPAAASVDGLWQRLTRLWKIIDKGNSELDVPAYNGGLFRADEHPFLEEHIVGDKHLRNAIDLLARSPTNESGAPEFVDYRDLNVRHLGSVYEGLLEYELRVADTNLSIVEHDGQENYEETAPSDSADVEEGDVFLVTEGGERKRSGSYYTPDFVVRYIVDKTVGPVLEDLKASHQDGGADSDNPTELIEAVLDVNVLDPAMGSGHFLVGVVDYIARFLVEVADAGHVDDQDKRDAETELAYWRRRVAQSCVYGVDQNPLAVELSKLSLWLRTVAREKPLSFLDHHLCVGNSLISSSVEDLPLQQEQSEHFERKERRASEAGQVSMMDDPEFADSVRQAAEWMDDIEDLEGDTVEEVQRAEQIYEQSVRAATKEPRLIADVQTAREFGLEISDELFGELSHRILRGGYEGVPKFEDLLNEARRIADDFSFFHWELEFPEVFFDQTGRFQSDAGFDAVVGNPPYVRMEQFKWFKDYLESHYEVHAERADLYAYFIELSVKLCRTGGRYGAIVSNKWLRSDYGEKTRKFLLRNLQLEQLVDFGDLPVFGEETSTYPLILEGLRTKGSASADRQIEIGLPEELPSEGLEHELNAEASSVSQSELGGEAWGLELMHLRGFFDSLRSDYVSFFEWVGHEPMRGVVTGLNDAFVISKDVRDQLVEVNPDAAEILLPVCKGNEVRRYRLERNERSLIYAYHGIPISEYPAVENYLEDYRADLEGRATDQAWYELQQPQGAYEEHFRGTKILNPDMAQRGRFTLEDDTVVPLNTAYFIPSDSHFLLAILNSSLTTAFLRSIAAQYRGDYFRLFGHSVRKVPIPAEQIRSKSPSAQTLKAADTLFNGEDGIEDPTFQRLLAKFAKRISKAHRKRLRLERAMNPFKFLDSGVDFSKFGDVFEEWLAEAEMLEDLGQYHHDIDGLRMTSAESGNWMLDVQLKLRDESSDWEDWIKEDRSIVRKWVTAYRFPTMSEQVGAYFRVAFEASRDDFAESSSFVGGKTRSTHKKLQLSLVPEFDSDVKLEKLRKLEDNLRETKDRIRNLDSKVDEIVYEMYGLAESDIAKIEKAAE